MNCLDASRAAGCHGRSDGDGGRRQRLARWPPSGADRLGRSYLLVLALGSRLYARHSISLAGGGRVGTRFEGCRSGARSSVVRRKVALPALAAVARPGDIDSLAIAARFVRHKNQDELRQSPSGRYGPAASLSRASVAVVLARRRAVVCLVRPRGVERVGAGVPAWSRSIADPHARRLASGQRTTAGHARRSFFISARLAPCVRAADRACRRAPSSALTVAPSQGGCAPRRRAARPWLAPPSVAQRKM